MAVGCWLRAGGCWRLLFAGCLLLAAGCWMLTVAAACRWLLIAGCCSLAVGCWMFPAGWLLGATCLLMQGGTVLSRQVEGVSEEGSRKSGGGDNVWGVWGVWFGGGCVCWLLSLEVSYCGMEAVGG